MERQPDELLSTSEVAELRGVTRQTVSLWIDKHGLPCHRVAGVRLVKYADAVAFQRRKPTGRPKKPIS